MLTSAASKQRKSSPVRGGSLRAAILKAARKILLSEGIAAITARRVAADAGCSATAIYLYFTNLDEVLFELRMHGHAILARYMAAAHRPRDTWARLRAMGNAYCRFGVENPAYYDLMFLSRRSPSPKREEVQKEAFTLMMLHELLAAGVERGDVRKDLDLMVATNVIWSQVHGVTSLSVQGMLTLTAPRGNREILDAVFESAEGWLKARSARMRLNAVNSVEEDSSERN